MAEELGKIEKPSAENYRSGKKIFYVPLIFNTQEMPEEYSDKCARYWEQVDSQVYNLENSLGPVTKIFHELVSESADQGLKILVDLKINSHSLVKSRIQKGATLEVTEDNDILTELMDWSRCLSLGLQNKKVFSNVYSSYTEANKKRYEAISKNIAASLKDDEICLVILGDNHGVKFPDEARVFYIAPPALDEVKRWLRDYETTAHNQGSAKNADSPQTNSPESTSSS
jgi:hypothetical protein